MAVVDDSDLHAGWERVLPLWREKEPVIDMFLGKRVALPLFFERAVIEVRPRRAFLWEDGRTMRPLVAGTVAQGHLLRRRRQLLQH